MVVIRTDDYASRNQNEIFASSIVNRVEELHTEVHENNMAGEYDEDATAEWEALLVFRGQVERVTGKHFEEATIVPEEMFTEHARQWANELADIEFLDTYVNWEKFAADLRADRYTTLAFGVDIVYVR
jgi:hypothetical protein